MKTVSYSVQGPAGIIETLVELPKDLPKGIGIICHPHPQHEGTMNNKVVTTVFRAFLRCGLAAVRFNYRGVGQSEGEYDEGRGETDDAVAIYDWAQSLSFLPSGHGEAAESIKSHCVIAGFSFGAFIAANLCQQRPADCLISLAPAVHHGNFADKTDIDIPWHVLMGDQDEIVPPQSVYDWVDSMPQPISLHHFNESSHFFHGQLVAVREKCEQIIQNTLAF